jgi:predicted enzyme related to lactoylglutathione lyase
MSDRDGFAPGVPCLVTGVFPDPRAATAFYSDLFGWETEDLMPEDHPGSYVLGSVRGRDAAAIVSQHGAPAPSEPVWTTLIWVESADEAAAKAADAGGQVVGQPFDSPGGGRQAVLADPAGAAFSVWEPRERRGAQVVNEPGAWAMSSLITDDPGDARRFYSELFGWDTRSFDMGGAEITMFTVPDFVGGEPQQPVPRDVVAVMAPPSDDDEGPPRWMVDFWVADIDTAVSTLSDAGGEVLVPPYELMGGGMRQTVVRDPHGAVLTLTQPPSGAT